QKLILQPVTHRQLLVELFKVFARLRHDLRLTLAHGVDAIGQRQRQQRNFHHGADLAGVHRPEIVRQMPQQHGGVNHATDQERRPGKDEIPCNPPPFQPGSDADQENDRRKDQYQCRDQAQRNSVIGGERQNHDPRRARHHQPQWAVHPETQPGRLQEFAGELTGEQDRGGNQKRRGRVGPPWIIRPQKFDPRAIDRYLIQTEAGDIEDVIKVAGVPHAQVDEQVVDQHYRQDAVNHPENVQPRRLLLDVRVAGPQIERCLNGAMTLDAHVRGLAL
nr:hypothetical protein [Tanacetum cinerariifolium]